MDSDREVPHHFICPISLQIMKDPVTVATGITYDRESIQRWQSHGRNNTCPVTNQPLPSDVGFTPNHNLRRLIESWRVSDQSHPSKQSEVKVIGLNLVRKLSKQDLKFEALKSLENLAYESENNRVWLREVGVVKAMVLVVNSCCDGCVVVGLKEALNVLYLVRVTQDETSLIPSKHERIINSLTWVLDLESCDNDNHDDNDDDVYTTMKFHALVLLKDIIQTAKSHVLERLNRNFFKTITLILHHQKGKNLEQDRNMIKEVLHVMLSTCAWPRNCSIMVDSGAIFELIELELGSPEKAITELIMGVLFHLCSSADGRAQLVGHAAGIAMITKRIGRVSHKVDERILMIISSISKFSGTDGVLQEMVRVGTVEKLCMVLQVYGMNSHTRDTARDILKRHSNVWKDSPCLDQTLLTMCIN